MFKLDTPKTVCREKDTVAKDIYAQKDSCIYEYQTHILYSIYIR